MLIKLAYRSLLQRKTAAIMIILAISLSMSALLLTRSLSSELKNSFNSSYRNFIQDSRETETH